jgi:hypothetical protein
MRKCTHSTECIAWSPNAQRRCFELVDRCVREKMQFLWIPSGEFRIFATKPDNGKSHVPLYPSFRRCSFTKNLLFWYCLLKRFISTKKQWRFSFSTACRRMGRLQVRLHSFLTSALDGGKWLNSRSGRFYSGKSLGTHWIGRWVGLSAFLTFRRRKNLSHLTWIRNAGRSGRSVVDKSQCIVHLRTAVIMKSRPTSVKQVY